MSEELRSQSLSLSVDSTGELLYYPSILEPLILHNNLVCWLVEATDKEEIKWAQWDMLKPPIDLYPRNPRIKFLSILGPYLFSLERFSYSFRLLLYPLSSYKRIFSDHCPNDSHAVGEIWTDTKRQHSLWDHFVIAQNTQYLYYKAYSRSDPITSWGLRRWVRRSQVYDSPDYSLEGVWAYMKKWEAEKDIPTTALSQASFSEPTWTDKSLSRVGEIG